ncbi:MAG TPA: insulinase family protein [Firmicutes bacterium]|nr:insulinase family protein [Candidatus Fermentithermobacillaceae bacterium]
MDTHEYLLDNGLKVIAREMHHAPLVAFFVWYRVGGRNEVPGVTGISHWVEHMMFKGTRKYKKGELDRAVSRHGGVWNAFTWIDFTAYFEVLPANYLDLSLDIESDRMINCLFDPAEVDAERTVIISEREGAENSPEFWLDEAVTRVAYLVHPYGQGVIGAKSDLLSMTRDDLYNHYRRYYSPDNAVAVVVGDFSSAEVFEKIKHYFGGIPKGPERPKVRSIEPPQEGERRVFVRRPGGTIYGELAYHIPRASDPEFYPVVVLDAILSGGKALAGWGGTGGMGKSSRLYKALVEREIATSAVSAAEPSIDPGLLKISLTLRHGVSYEQAESAVLEVLDRLMQEKVSSLELERAKKQLRAQIAYSQEGVQSNALSLGVFEMVSSWKDADMVQEKILAVTADDVLNAAQKFLNEKNRTVGWFIPEEGKGLASGAVGGTGAALSKAGYAFRHRGYVFTGSSQAGVAFKLPGPDDIKRKVLSNGTVILGYRNPYIDFTTVLALVDAGNYGVPREKAGLAQITNACLLRGTSRRSAEEIHEFTDSLGMSLQVSAGRDTAILSVSALSEDVEKAVSLFGEILKEPAFSPKEVDKLKGQQLTSIKASEQDTQSTCERIFNEMVYPESHPYHSWILGYEDTVKSITEEDLRSFYHAFYRPDRTTIAFVTNLEVDRVVSLLEENFEGWSPEPEAHERARKASEGRLAEVPRPRGRKETHKFIAGKTQCDIALGFPCISRSDPDYLKFTVADMILGRLGLGGRIGRNVRDEKGLAYYVYSNLPESKGPAPWVVRAGVNPKGVEKAVSSILEEIRRFRDSLCSEDELDEVKGYLVGRLPLSIETAYKMAATIASLEYFGLGLDYLVRYPAAIAAVTREDVLEMARRYLSSEDYILVITGPNFK